MAQEGGSTASFVTGIVAFVVCLVLIAGIFFLYNSNSDSVQKTDHSWSEVVGDNIFAKLLTYTVSQEPFSLGATNPISAGIIVIALWVLIFISFSNIISDFSTFNPVTSWIIGFCLAVVAANSGLVAGIAAAMTGAFIMFGVASVYVGLAASFVVFIALNWGLMGLGTWMAQRKAIKQASDIQAKSIVGKARLKAGADTLATVGRAAEDASR